MRVAIQGIEGSFHEEAALKILGNETEIVSCKTFQDVFAAVKNGSADQGVVAIENSLHGSINPVYRLLAREKLWVAGEISLKIEQYLISATEVDPVDFTIIDTVISQAPALAQCEQWLDEHLPACTLEETHDTAESVQYVMRYSEKPIAAIASRRAAKLYGGKVIAGPINDDPHNYTRFFLLAPEPKTDPKADRTSVILRTSHKPGALYDALSVFKNLGIDLSKLDSHPIAGDKRHYAFYVDFDAGLETDAARTAVAELIHQDCEVNILGSYPKSNLPL